MAALLLLSVATTAQVYDATLRRDTFRHVGLAPDGQSMGNFSVTPDFVWALENCFGFTAEEVSLAQEKCRRGEVRLKQYEPGRYTGGFTVWGGARRSVEFQSLGFWMETIVISVNAKTAEFMQICGNPIRISGGRFILAHTEVRTDVRTETVVQPGATVEYTTPGPTQYVDRPVPGPVQLVPCPVPCRETICPPTFREGQPASLGSYATDRTPPSYVTASYTPPLKLQKPPETPPVVTCPPLPGGIKPPPVINNPPPEKPPVVTPPTEKPPTPKPEGPPNPQPNNNPDTGNEGQTGPQTPAHPG